MSNKRDTIGSTSSNQRRKTVKLDHQDVVIDDESQRRLAMRTLVERLARGSVEDCQPAWSINNLLAIPTPVSPGCPSFLESSFNIPSSSPLSITITHFAGSPLPVDRKGKSPRRSRLVFTLTLPPTLTRFGSAPARISHLSFSPDGSQLLAVTREPGMNDRLTVFAQVSDCINQWEVVWNETLGRFGEEVAGGKHVVDVRWLGEARKWFPSTSTTSSKPFFCTPAHAVPVLGSAFLLVLSSQSLFFAHIPRCPPLIPQTLLLPLNSSASSSALPTPASGVASSSRLNDTLIESPQTAMDDLVANLVGGPSPLPHSVDTGEQGAGALRDQLRAAQKSGDDLRVVLASIGVVRTQQPVGGGETLFLIATTLQSTPPAPPISSTIPESLVQERLASSQIKESIPDRASGIDSSVDFSGLDEAFGDSPLVFPLPAADTVNTLKRPTRVGRRRSTQNRVEMTELRVELFAPGGPRLTLRTLSPIYLCSPASTENVETGILTHLEWLEDNERSASESSDLKLLSVMASDTGNGKFCSSLRSWTISKEPSLLSDAFAGLECKKSDATVGELEWTSRETVARQHPELISLVLPRAHPTVASFIVGSVNIQEDARPATKISIFDSHSLDYQDNTDTSTSLIYLASRAQISPNLALICVIHENCVGLVGGPLGDGENLIRNLARHLAMATIRQTDTSDIIGRVIGLKATASILAVLNSTYQYLQSMLSRNRSIETTPLQLELLGIASNLFRSNPATSLRSEIAHDILQLAACERAFRSNQGRSRKGVASGYQCDADVIWPLTGYASWFCDFSYSLVKDIVDEGTQTEHQTPRRLLLLHPLPRSLLLRSLDYILGLQYFLSLASTSNIIAKGVLDDAINDGGLSMIDFKAVLVGLGEVEIRAEDLRAVLIELSLPDSLAPASAQLSTLLASPTLLHGSQMATPPREPLLPSNATDVMRRSRIDFTAKYRTCTKCGERVDNKAFSSGTVCWSIFETTWRAKCLCGGLWASLVE